MVQDEWRLYWKPARDNLMHIWGTSDFYRASRRLETFLGTTHHADWHSNGGPRGNLPLSDNLKTVLTALSTEHAEVILKILEAQTGRKP